jgi:8-oxo-dGTP pyrophosphatase MutT (NUDIX family)
MPISNYLRDLRAKVGHELLLMPSVTVITYDDRGRILLVRHAENDIWAAPGGSIDPHELPADAAVREMWEETGLLVEPVRVMGVYSGAEFQVNYSNGDQVCYVMTVFECRLLEGEMRPDGEETLEIGYFSQADLQTLKLPSWAHVVLPEAFNRREQAYFQRPTWKPPAEA